MLFLLQNTKNDSASDTKKLKMNVSPGSSRPPSTGPDLNSNSNSGSLGQPDDQESEEPEEDSETTDIEEEPSDGGDFSLNMDVTCVTCKSSTASQTNQLIECQECHSLYHQNCHRPAITEHNINDPRVVWYCVKCAKNMKKAANKAPKLSTITCTPASSSVSTSLAISTSPVSAPKSSASMTSSASFASAANQGRESALQLLKAKAEKGEQIIQPFKRIESKSNAAAATANSQVKPIGLAGFAANLNRTNDKTTPTGCLTANASPTISSLSTTFTTSVAGATGNSSTNNTVSSSSSKSNAELGKQADKRMQMMKKKQILKLKK